MERHFGKLPKGKNARENSDFKRKAIGGRIHRSFHFPFYFIFIF